MRDPAAKARVYGVALVIGLVLLGAGIWRINVAPGQWTTFAVLFPGMLISMFSFVLFLQTAAGARGQANLLAGKGHLARWHLSPEEWDRFRAFDAARIAAYPNYLGEMFLRDETPPEGVDVIVTQTSIMIDGSYHVLRRGALPGLTGITYHPGDPECLEFSLFYPGGRYGGAKRALLRAPYPLDARPQARAVYDHFLPKVRGSAPLILRNPALNYKIVTVALILAVAGTYAGLRMMEEARSNQVDEETIGMVGMALLVVCPFVGAFALLIALLTFLMVRSRAKAQQ